MDRFQEMQVFLTVAEEESFASAAKRLNMSASSVTRAVAALEERIGTLLLARTTRNLHVTEAGQRYQEDCRRILAELVEAEESAVGNHANPRGQLAITASVMFGDLFVTPLLVEYLAAHPDVQIKALLVDRVVNMVEEGIDVAVRIGHLPDSTQPASAIKVGEVRRVLCASPAYLAEHGRPQHPDDLKQARLIVSSTSTLVSEWEFASAAGPLAIKPQSRLTVGSNQAAINAACMHWGIARVLSYQVASPVASGELELVLRDFELPAVPIHLVYQGDRRVPSKVRTFVDFCAARLSGNAALNPQR
jgi:DNA-binding transcriptional LysR family regulator